MDKITTFFFNFRFKVFFFFTVYKILCQGKGKMSVKYTKKPFNMLTMKSFCEWLTSLNPCPTDSTLLPLPASFSYSQICPELLAKLSPIQRGISSVEHLGIREHFTVMLRKTKVGFSLWLGVGILTQGNLTHSSTSWLYQVLHETKMRP